ncbi:cyanate hydratase [Dermatophagoides farinae]|uniref:Cyanate lyase C-terminal domain-containing protein n=1 Tax=Dermatophagoides farinae TaxID=6954 RepID=A0A922I9T2_DERFA|nr:cyanate hydratase-like [Dermatophagoides farinae]KAH7641125.1 hypothetical protein HUG17_4169 [Dermatophagoides farinae]KAH9526843.1 hypothetical protein DERF_000901 [Dermatophagoides farinae]
MNRNLSSLMRNFSRYNSTINSDLNLNFMSKNVASKIILDAKRKSNLKFAELANKLEVNKVWLTSAILGQHPINEQLSRQLVKILSIQRPGDEMEKLIQILGSIPDNRGLVNQTVTRDPTIRRLNELLDIYGDTFKTLIKEEFGDGIMSAIDCTVHFEKQTIDDKEDRIVITINGKYLQYKNDK